MKPRVLRQGRKLVLHYVRRFFEVSSRSEHRSRKFIDYFVTDDKDLCTFAYERGSLTKLSQIVNSITPTDRPPTWEEEESEHVSSLREVSSEAKKNPPQFAYRDYNRLLLARSQPFHCGITISAGRLPRTIP